MMLITKITSLISLTTIITLLFLEAALRIVLRESMTLDIEMWKYANKIKQIDSDPNIAFIHKASSSGFFMGTTITTNKFGDRDEEYLIPKPASVYRIVVIGDSVTLGWGVDAKDTFAEKLERKLNDYIFRDTHVISRVEVINMGIGNYNTTQEVRHFIRDGLKYQPDLIVVGYTVNDAELIPTTKGNFATRNSYLYVLFYSSLDRLSRILNIKPGYHDYYNSLYDDISGGWIKVEESLKDLKKTANQADSKMVVISIPELRSVGPGYPFKFVDEKLKKFGNDNGIEIISLYPSFYNFIDNVDKEKLWVSPGDSHPSSLAHEIIADELYNSMSSRFKDNDKQEK